VKNRKRVLIKTNIIRYAYVHFEGKLFKYHIDKNSIFIFRLLRKIAKSDY
jgi:hypothetical protein